MHTLRQAARWVKRNPRTTAHMALAVSATLAGHEILAGVAFAIASGAQLALHLIAVTEEGHDT